MTVIEPGTGNLRVAECASTRAGMPVADMVRYAELVRAGDHTFAERQELLMATRADVRRRIAELQDTLTLLDFKIDLYADDRRVPESA